MRTIQKGGCGRGMSDGLHDSVNALARQTVDLENFGDRAGSIEIALLERAFNQLRNVSEADRTGEEAANGGFIGGIQDRRGRAPGLEGFARDPQRGKAGEIRL